MATSSPSSRRSRAKSRRVRSTLRSSTTSSGTRSAPPSHLASLPRRLPMWSQVRPTTSTSVQSSSPTSVTHRDASAGSSRALAQSLVSSCCHRVVSCIGSDCCFTISSPSSRPPSPPLSSLSLSPTQSTPRQIYSRPVHHTPRRSPTLLSFPTTNFSRTLFFEPSSFCGSLRRLFLLQ